MLRIHRPTRDPVHAAHVARKERRDQTQVVVTRSSHPRAASPLDLAAEFAKAGIKPKITNAVGQALSQTLALARKSDLICVTGSLFVVAEALDYMAGLQTSGGKLF